MASHDPSVAEYVRVAAAEAVAVAQEENRRIYARKVLKIFRSEFSFFR